MAGRGARKEARAVIEAFEEAMEVYGEILLKWQRALGDFKSTTELNPADTNAIHNAEVVEKAIAKLVDSIRKMQQAMMPMPMPGNMPSFSQVMDQLKERIPGGMIPPGGEGDDDDDLLPSFLRGLKEGPSKQGEEKPLTLSPDEAGDLLRGLRLNEKQGLPIGGNEQGKPANREGRNW